MQRLDIYKCAVCGNIIEVLAVGGGTLVCCNEDMTLLQEGVVEASHEKHVPVIEKVEDGYIVKVGSISHPMLVEHWIEWIELLADGVSYRKFLSPGDAPEVKFCIQAEKVSAREYCNLHGLWKA